MSLFRRRTVWTLADAGARHAASPDTFRVPTADELAGVRVGQSVKVIVVPENGLEERVWVQVTGMADERLDGVLRHDPTEIVGLHSGDPLRFERRNVVAVDRRRRE